MKGDIIAELASPGDSASGLGWDGTHLWIANLQTALGGGQSRVSWHDPITGQELGGFAMGSNVFHGLAFDGQGRIWTDNFHPVEILLTNIVQLDTAGSQLAVMPAYGTIYGVAYDTDEDLLYQVDNHSVEPGGGFMTGDLYVVRAADGTLVAGPIPTEVVKARGVAWDGTALWVASNEADSVYRIDVQTGDTLDQFVAPGEGGIEGVAYDGQCVWISDTRGDVIYRVDHGQSDLPDCEPLDAGTGTGTDSGSETGAQPGDTGGSGGDPDGGASTDAGTDSGTGLASGTDGDASEGSSGAAPSGAIGMGGAQAGCACGVASAPDGGALLVALIAAAVRWRPWLGWYRGSRESASHADARPRSATALER